MITRDVSDRRRKIVGDVVRRALARRKHMQVTELAELTGRHRSVVSEALNGKLVSEETLIAIEIALTPPLVDGLLKAILQGDEDRILRMAEAGGLEGGFATYIVEELRSASPLSGRLVREANGER
jgi:hypothetical protein